MGGEDEILDEDDFEEVFVIVHELFKGRISSSGGYILCRGGLGTDNVISNGRRMEDPGESSAGVQRHSSGGARRMLP